MIDASDPSAPNLMKYLRRFALQNTNATGPVTLSAAEAAALSEGIVTALSVCDAVWEMGAGRKLTDVEKGMEATN